ncbi:hypothetical protein BV25DRAFT_1825231 [Artomyces pyxidatus]|uniref:Uncharacterized protein n=1 Tax=Artomyces pyxidatus TaxID=48021 RepID=A0ACB8T2V2_9AGAM|nr:hypothetical protein BV25DRAFT_1825231 [Artomyces pyxidatus]
MYATSPWNAWYWFFLRQSARARADEDTQESIQQSPQKVRTGTRGLYGQTVPQSPAQTAVDRKGLTGWYVLSPTPTSDLCSLC